MLTNLARNSGARVTILQPDPMKNETDKADAEKVGNAADMALQAIQQLSESVKAEFSDMLSEAAQIVMAAKEERPKPKPVRIEVKRVNGKQVGSITYDDDSSRELAAERGPNGEMIGMVN